MERRFTMTKTAYNTAELVTVMSARALEDGKIVFGGGQVYAADLLHPCPEDARP